MKNRQLASRASAWGALVLLFALSAAGNAFTRVSSVTISAAATVGTGTSVPGVTTFRVPQLLPSQAFFGKDVVLPIEIVAGGAGVPAVGVASAPAGGMFHAAVPFGSFAPSIGNSNGQGVTMVYRLLDRARNPIGSSVSVPVGFRLSNGRFSGDGIIPIQNLQAIRRGGFISYSFQAQNGPTQIGIQNAGVPFEIEITDEFTFPVFQAGSIAVIPDTNVSDGKTSLAFTPNALSTDGLLRVRWLDPALVQAGPGGLARVVAYDFSLEGTSLARDFLLNMSYPARTDGSIVGFNGSPTNLAPYHLQNGEWLVLGPRTLDQTRHTVGVVSPHFSTFALFLSAATSPSDLRPRRRILTPNGDGINDTIDFSGIVTGGVNIFDMNGRRVRDLTSSLIWDGRDDHGRIVESGLYLYQYSSQGERVSGVILIAK
jgi:hypothetical protein